MHSFGHEASIVDSCNQWPDRCTTESEQHAEVKNYQVRSTRVDSWRMKLHLRHFEIRFGLVCPLLKPYHLEAYLMEQSWIGFLGPCLADFACQDQVNRAWILPSDYPSRYVFAVNEMQPSACSLKYISTCQASHR